MKIWNFSLCFNFIGGWPDFRPFWGKCNIDVKLDMESNWSCFLVIIYVSSRHGVIFETVGSLLSLLRTGEREAYRQFFLDAMEVIEGIILFSPSSSSLQYVGKSLYEIGHLHPCQIPHMTFFFEFSYNVWCLFKQEKFFVIV